MEQLFALIQEAFTIDLMSVTISNSRKNEGLDKIKIRPVLLKGALLFQVTQYDKTKVYHQNMDKEEIETAVQNWITTDFKQMQLEHTDFLATVLVSKKGQALIKRKSKGAGTEKSKVRPMIDLSHNRMKHYILEEGKPVPFLQDLGVMTADGKIVRTKYDKFRQINRFLEFIEDILPKLSHNREVTILDFGCGKSYLTFAMYYYLKELNGYDVRIIGLDLKEDVIAHCNGLKDKYGYEKLQFLVGDIASYTGVSKVDMVVTLHACDTATDYALAKAVQWEAKVILSVPCCQHEVNRQIQSTVLEPVLKYGLLKERMAALITDGLRAELLEHAGYQVQILEFIDMEHTPKNILIRAVKNEKEMMKTRDQYEACTEFLHIQPTLAKLLPNVQEGRQV